MADQEIHAKQGEPVKMNVLALPHDHSLPGEGDTKEPCASDNAGPLSLKTSVIGGANPAGATDDDGNPDTSAKGHYNCCVKGREKPDLANGGRLEDVLDTTEDGLFVKGRQKPTGAETADSGAKFKETYGDTSFGGRAVMMPILAKTNAAIAGNGTGTVKIIDVNGNQIADASFVSVKNPTPDAIPANVAVIIGSDHLGQWYVFRGGGAMAVWG